ncbi:MAG: hypothetical protein Q9173_005570 [Seirophora scorigena]
MAKVEVYKVLRFCVPSAIYATEGGAAVKRLATDGPQHPKQGPRTFSMVNFSIASDAAHLSISFASFPSELSECWHTNFNGLLLHFLGLGSGHEQQSEQDMVARVCETTVKLVTLIRHPAGARFVIHCEGEDVRRIDVAAVADVSED